MSAWRFGGFLATTLVLFATSSSAQTAPARSRSESVPAAQSSRMRTTSIALLASGSALTAGGVALFVAGGAQPTGRLYPIPPGSVAPTSPVGFLYFAGGLALGLGVGAVITGAVLYTRRADPERQSTSLALRSFGVGPTADGITAAAMFSF
jgi:hypothetical protein